MSLEIYKKGQGKTARITAYALLGVLILFGAYRLHATFNVPGEGVLVGTSGKLWGDTPPLIDASVPVLGTITIMKVVSVIAFGLGMLALHLVLNGPKMATILIDTEQEMRKVSWPSKTEVRSATIVVVIVTFVMALSLYGFDVGLQHLFSLVF
jgi:preprotein translocase SecE subunit